MWCKIIADLQTWQEITLIGVIWSLAETSNWHANLPDSTLCSSHPSIILLFISNLSWFPYQFSRITRFACRFHWNTLSLHAKTLLFLVAHNSDHSEWLLSFSFFEKRIIFTFYHFADSATDILWAVLFHAFMLLCPNPLVRISLPGLAVRLLMTNYFSNWFL